jgi:hypothetical protein
MISRDSVRALLYDVRLRCMAVGIVLVVTAIACDKAVLLGPVNSSITLTAGARILPPGGTTSLTAIVLENSGQPVPNGTTVRFTTSLGRVEPGESQTTNGAAVTTFHAGNDSGIADVRAISGLASGGTSTGTGTGTGGTTTTTAGNVVQITIGAAAANTVVVSASPTTVPTGGGTTTIAAAVLDTNGNRLPNVPVAFSTTQGSLSTTVANTDTNGEARVQLTTAQQAVVTASSGSKTGTVTVAIAPALGLTLTVSPNPTAGQPTTLTIVPATGTAPRVTLNWGDGSEENIGVVASSRTVNHTYQSQGAFSIRATGTFEGDTITADAVAIVGALPGPTITFSPSNPRTDQDVVFTITPAPGVATANVSIDFGDGTPAADLGAISSPTIARHRYVAGTFTVRVTQTNTAGVSSIGSTVVTVVTP